MAPTTKIDIKLDDEQEHHTSKSSRRRWRIVAWLLLVFGICFVQIHQSFQVVVDTEEKRVSTEKEYSETPVLENPQKEEKHPGKRNRRRRRRQQHQQQKQAKKQQGQHQNNIQSDHDMKESNGEELLYGIPPPPEDEYIPLRNDNNSTFSACLLVMDSNHYLIEWLAYHYHVLPLRYLVITVDPRSKTTPDEILNRWERRQNNIDRNDDDDKYDDSMMTIVKWNDSRFLPYEWQRRQVSENDPIGKIAKHRQRQNHFYRNCFEFLKKAQRSWTMVIDVDEFARVNPHYKHYNHNGNNKKKKKKQKTVLETIHDNSDLYHHNISCITMPRLRFGNFENEVNSTAIPTETTRMESNSSFILYDGFVSKNFLTLRWKWRAGLHSRRDNHQPKSMINLQHISKFTKRDTNPHRPVRSECPKSDLYLLNRQSPFSVHHYVGTVEQFSFRDDARKGLKTRSEKQLQSYNSIKKHFDDTISGWINGFVQEVGPNTSKELLMDVGNVSYSIINET